MTREEAKKILEAYIACESKKAHFECDDYNCDDNCPLRYEMGTVGEHNEAINMAIQALEQEPSEDAISREAVEEIINDIRDCISVEGYWAILERLKKLPSVKPQEPCDVPDINVGDIISKQTVLDTISELNAISFYEAQEDSKECYYEIRQAIENLSPVTSQPKTGHWEWVQYDSNPNIGNWHCSECGSIVIECVSKEKKGGIPLYKYCPQCGAKIE